MKLGDEVRITLQLVDFDEKRLHFYMEIRHVGEGWVAATCENLSLHVDMATRKVIAFPEDISRQSDGHEGRPFPPRPAAGAWPRGRHSPAAAQAVPEPLLAMGTRH